MSNTIKTIQIELADNAKSDGLIECIMYLRILDKGYPGSLEPAFNALLNETKSPPKLIYPQVSGGVAKTVTVPVTTYNVAPPQEAQE